MRYGNAVSPCLKTVPRQSRDALVMDHKTLLLAMVRAVWAFFFVIPLGRTTLSRVSVVGSSEVTHPALSDGGNNSPMQASVVDLSTMHIGVQIGRRYPRTPPRSQNWSTAIRACLALSY